MPKVRKRPLRNERRHQLRRTHAKRHTDRRQKWFYLMTYGEQNSRRSPICLDPEYVHVANDGDVS